MSRRFPFLIATTPTCKGELFFIGRIAPFYPWSLLYNAECEAKCNQLPFLESLVILDIGLELRSPWPLANTQHIRTMSDRYKIILEIIKKKHGIFTLEEIKLSKIGDPLLKHRTEEKHEFNWLLHQGVREGATPFPGLLHFTLDPYLIMLSVKSRRYQVPFFESLVWLDLGLNPDVPDYRYFISMGMAHRYKILLKKTTKKNMVSLL